MKRRKARPTALEESRYIAIQHLEARVEWYQRTRRRKRRQIEIAMKLASAEIDRLKGIIARECQSDIQIKPRKAAPWQLPTVRTPGGLPIGSDGGNTTTVTVQKDGSLACTGLPKGSTFDWT